jgi:hypothetical protein
MLLEMVNEIVNDVYSDVQVFADNDHDVFDQLDVHHVLLVIVIDYFVVEYSQQNSLVHLLHDIEYHHIDLN